jgi:hypothetical protein
MALNRGVNFGLLKRCRGRRRLQVVADETDYVEWQCDRGVLEVMGVQVAEEWECPAETGEGPVEQEGPVKEESCWGGMVGAAYSVESETDNIVIYMAQLNWCFAIILHENGNRTNCQNAVFIIRYL